MASRDPSGPRERDRDRERAIEMTIELAARPDAVFRAISEPGELVKWLAPEARLARRDDGTSALVLSWGDGMSAEEPIALVEPPRRLRYAFGEDPRTRAPLWVDWDVLPPARDGAGTTLRLVHSGFASGAEAEPEIDAARRGWRVFLLNLRHYLERHAGRSCRQRAFVIRTPATREEVWRHVVALDRHGKLAAHEEEGARHHVAIGPRRSLSGTVEIFAPARDLALTIAELDEALLRISLEDAARGTMVYGVVLAFGDAAPAAEPLAAEIEAALRAALRAHA
jgi:uncharacterized protein YndB with AHSA1/START domain